MSLIKDISEIPMSKTMTWILVGAVIMAPANLIFYYFEPELYLSVDLVKMLILTCGTALMYFFPNFIAAFILTLIELKREHIKQDNLLNAALSTTLIVLIVTLAVACFTVGPRDNLKYFLNQLGVLQTCLNASLIAVAIGSKILDKRRIKKKIS